VVTWPASTCESARVARTGEPYGVPESPQPANAIASPNPMIRTGPPSGRSDTRARDRFPQSGMHPLGGALPVDSGAWFAFAS
jgi:hypothetical protein